MDVKTTLRDQMRTLHGITEAAIADSPPKIMSRKLPGSTINSIGAIYAHTVFGQDGLVNGLIRGDKPVYFGGGWAPKVGIEMPQGGMEPDWDVSMDLGVFRQYAAAVYESVDDCLASASEADLERVVDASTLPI